MTDDYVSRTNRNRLSRVPLSRRQLLTGLGGAALALSTTALTGCTITKGEPPISTLGLSKDPAKRPNGRPRAHNLSMYSLWGATVGQGLVAVAQEFEAANPDIGVGITFAPASGTVQQKPLTAVAGHEPPDIAQVVTLETPQWAALGIMTDLTDWFERDGLSLDDYFAPAAEAMTYNDRVYSMNWDADPNFPLFWNKDLFEQSGLDPEKPPTTIEEVDEFNAKILKRDGGMATKVGLTPWDNYGFSNSIFTWGFAFGGRFRTPGTDDVTPDDEYVVKALEWICESAKKVGGPDAVSIAPPSLALHSFSTGNLGMAPLVSSNLKDIVAAVPDLKFGSTLLPYGPPGGSKPGQGAWIGGWSAFIPTRAKEPEAAWEFIKWWSSTDAGTTSSWKNVGFPVSYKKSSSLALVKEDPIMQAYYDTLVNSTNTRPPVLVADFFTQQLETEVAKAVYGQETPLQALRNVKAATDAETKRFKREIRSGR